MSVPSPRPRTRKLASISCVLAGAALVLAGVASFRVAAAAIAGGALLVVVGLRWPR